MKLIYLFCLSQLLAQSVISQTLEWQQACHYNYFTNGQGTAVDSQGNVFLAGASSDYRGNPSASVFIQKYSPTGVLLWKRNSGLTFACTTGGVVVDALGNSYISVSVEYQDSIQFGSQRYAGGAMFLLKYDSAGQLLWMTIDGSGTPHDMAIDREGHIYVTGFGFTKKYYNTGACILTIPYGLTSMAVDDAGTIYLPGRKYNSAGTLTGTFGPSNWGPSTAKIACDQAGNCYLSYEGWDAISTVEKINANCISVWTQTVPAWGAYSIKSDGSGNTYVGGYYNNGSGGILINKYSPQGSLTWSYDLPNPMPNPYNKSYEIYKIEIDQRFIFAVGDIRVGDAFLLKISDPDNISVGFKNQETGANLNVSPNPSTGQVFVSYSQASHNQTDIRIRDLTGKCVYEDSLDESGSQQVDLGTLTKGVYVLEVNNETGRQVRKLILQ
jgi:hypothetical protein